MTWARSLFAGVLTVIGAALVFGAVHESAATAGGFDPGLAILALPFGLTALIAFGFAAWAGQTNRHGVALAASLTGSAAVILLMIAAALAYHEATTCLPVTTHCDSYRFSTVQPRVMAAMFLLVLDLVATSLIVLNALDGFMERRRQLHRHPRGG